MKKYQLGQKWSNDFDYEGMLTTGTQMDEQTPVKDLEKLHSSFEDVNYHSESNPLWKAIVAKKEGRSEILTRELADFRKLCQAALSEINE